MLEVLCLKL